MEPIITSILDLDQYKASMMNFVLQLYPDTFVTYKFKNRGTQRFNNDFLLELQRQINYLKDLKLQDDEYDWIKENIPYLPISYLEYLKNFRFDPDNVKIGLTEDNNLELSIEGKWVETILFETILMSIISELYFKIIDKNWNMEGQKERAKNKVYELSMNYCNFAEFGTRRRRSKKTQDLVIQEFKKFSRRDFPNSFVGSSNIYFCKKYNLKSIGSIAHEITQAMQALESLNHCNYYAMKNWLKVYRDVQIGTALTDTISVNMFLKDFNRKLSILYPSIRHDSGNSFIFTDKMIKHYKNFNIDPMSKMIIFSDGLNVDEAIKIRNYCEGKIKCSFGIGTSITNSFFKNNSTEISQPLNMVIKLWSVNGFPVVKLGEGKGKKNGDPEAIKNMIWVVKNQLGL